jgi:hypothetical protein
MITWTIDALKTKPIDNGNADVVCEVHWRAAIADEELSDGVYGSVGIEFKGGQFTPYENLTQEQVLEWVFEVINKAQIETSLNERMTELKSPKIVQKPNPWSN